MPLDRKVYFDSVRKSLFHGEMSQEQVDGQNYIIDVAMMLKAKGTAWLVEDIRWLAYCLATTYHETAQTMQPIEEYGKGTGMAYGVPDPQTKQTYYGRGYVMLSWRDNYAKATQRLGLSGTPDDLEWHAEKALVPWIAATIMFQGMTEAWFRPPHGLAEYFNDEVDDAYNARDIINGDKKTVPSWSGGIPIGRLVEDYHNDFLDALKAAWTEPLEPPPTGEPEQKPVVVVNVETLGEVEVTVTVNGRSYSYFR